MKKQLMALVLMPMMLLADQAMVGRVTLVYAVSGGKATITGAYNVSGALTIPSTLNGYPVTEIGKFALEGWRDLTSVTIPSSVINIGADAFFQCHGLISVTMLSGVKNIGACAFERCTSLTSVIMPSSVNSIGNGAFCDCLALTSLTIPSGVTSIGEDAFFGCSNLKNVFVDNNNAMYASDGGLLYNKAKTELICCPGGRIGSQTILESVTSIGYGAFYDCTELTSITLSPRLTSIGEGAFCLCGGLSSISIPSSVLTIGQSAFLDCDGLRTIYVARGDAQRIKGLIIGSGMNVAGISFVEQGVTSEYTVTFNANGGSCSTSSKQYSSGSTLGTLPTATRSGYTFDGWYTSSSGGTKVSSSTAVTGDVTYYAQWKAVSAKPVIVCESSYTITPGKSCSIPIKVESTVKKTTVTVSKLPKGLSFKSGKITGKAAKPGTTKVKVVAKNSKGTTTKYVTIKAVNPGFNVTLTARSNGAPASAARPIEKSGDMVQIYVGVQQTITIASTPGISGVSSSSAKVTVSGLPKGLTYKSGKISGVVRSTGSKTATVKFKNKWGWSKSFKIVIKAVSLPSSVRGTFNGFVSADVSWLYAHQDLSESDDEEDSCEDCGYSGYSGYDEDDAYDDYDSYWTWYDSVLWFSTPRSYVHGKTYALKVSSGTTGKLSAKLGSTSFTASKWTSAVDGVFKATLTNKSKKLVVIVDTNVQWPEASMTVSCSPSSSVYPYPGYAVRNPFGKSSSGAYSNAQAGHYVKLLTRLGATKAATGKTAYGYDLVCQDCMAVKPGYVFPLKVKVSSTGVATLTGKIGSKKISASAIIRIAPSGKALATYIVGGMAVDLLFDYDPAEAGHYDEWGDWIDPSVERYWQPSGHATLIK